MQGQPTSFDILKSDIERNLISESGILTFMKQQFVDLYSNILTSIESVSNSDADSMFDNIDSVSDDDKKLLARGYQNGIKRFACIMAKYAFDENDSKVVAYVERCKELNNYQMTKTRNKKPFKYDEIKLFHPYMKLRDFEAVDIEKHIRNGNKISKGFQFYIDTINKIIKDGVRITDDMIRVDTKMKRYLTFQNEDESKLLKRSVKNIEDLKTSDNDMYESLNIVMRNAERYVLRNFKKFVDVTIQLRIECEIATYELIDDKYGHDALSKRPLVNAMTMFSREAARLSAILQKVAACYEVYYLSEGNNVSNNLASLKKCIGTHLKPFFDESCNGRVCQVGGGFGSFLKNMAVKFYEFVIIPTAKFLAFTGSIVLTAVSAAITLLGCGYLLFAYVKYGLFLCDLATYYYFGIMPIGQFFWKICYFLGKGTYKSAKLIGVTGRSLVQYGGTEYKTTLLTSIFITSASNPTLALQHVINMCNPDYKYTDNDITQLQNNMQLANMPQNNDNVTEFMNGLSRLKDNCTIANDIHISMLQLNENKEKSMKIMLIIKTKFGKVDPDYLTKVLNDETFMNTEYNSIIATKQITTGPL